jgi:hypothetical protein
LQLRSAITAQPDYDSRRVYPEKGGHLSGHLYRFSTLQTLQRLYKEYPVVDVSVGSTISMYAFSFKHKLLLHGGPSSRAAPRELRYSDRNKILTSGADCTGGEKQGRANQEIFNSQTPQAHNATAAAGGQQTFVTCL